MLYFIAFLLTKLPASENTSNQAGTERSKLQMPFSGNRLHGGYSKTIGRQRNIANSGRHGEGSFVVDLLITKLHRVASCRRIIGCIVVRISWQKLAADDDGSIDD